MGGGWPLKRIDTLGIYLPPKHVLRCIERQATFYGLLCRRDKETKKNKVRNVATSPLPPPYTPKAACISFGMCGRVLDVINRAKFQLDRFRGFGAPGGRKSLSPIDWRYRPYNSVHTNVLHCDSLLFLSCTYQQWLINFASFFDCCLLLIRLLIITLSRHIKMLFNSHNLQF